MHPMCIRHQPAGQLQLQRSIITLSRCHPHTVVEVQLKASVHACTSRLKTQLSLHCDSASSRRFPCHGTCFQSCCAEQMRWQDVIARRCFIKPPPPKILTKHHKSPSHTLSFAFGLLKFRSWGPFVLYTPCTLAMNWLCTVSIRTHWAAYM